MFIDIEWIQLRFAIVCNVVQKKARKAQLKSERSVTRTKTIMHAMEQVEDRMGEREMKRKEKGENHKVNNQTAHSDIE